MGGLGYSMEYQRVLWNAPDPTHCVVRRSSPKFEGWFRQCSVDQHARICRNTIQAVQGGHRNCPKELLLLSKFQRSAGGF